ncbi:imelysin family protein [Thiothrix eikelboomii]|uniref:imelysin family protein n=1 Tax=Thiothrix eikelboomii TaxID=92487 RepID=UPI003BB0F9BA
MHTLQQPRFSLGQISFLLFSAHLFIQSQPVLADNTQAITQTSTQTTTVSTSQVATPTTNQPARDAALIQQLVTAGIQPLYRELQQQSQQLTQTSTEFCSTPTLENFQKLRTAWGETLLAWQRTDLLLFGPAIAEQLDFQINFAPPKKQIIKNLLASDQAISQADIVAAGVGAQGLSSLEYVLFDREQTTEQLLAQFQEAQGSVRCSYVQAVSALLEQKITQLSKAWLETDSTKFFTSNQEVIDLLIGKSYQTLEKINLKKIRLPFGMMDEKQLSHPYELEAWRSGYSFKTIQANIEGISRVFIDGGFLAWIDKTFPNDGTKLAVSAFEKQLKGLIQMQLPAGDPFTVVEQNIESPVRRELIERCRGLEMGIKRQLAIITQAQLGFNDNDGD